MIQLFFVRGDRTKIHISLVSLAVINIICFDAGIRKAGLVIKFSLRNLVPDFKTN